MQTFLATEQGSRTGIRPPPAGLWRGERNREPPGVLASQRWWRTCRDQRSRAYWLLRPRTGGVSMEVGGGVSVNDERFLSENVALACVRK